MSKTILNLEAINKTKNRDSVKMYDVIVIFKDGGEIRGLNNRLITPKNTKKTPQERVLTLCRSMLWNRQSERLDTVPGKDARVDGDLSEKNIKEIIITPTAFK